MALLNYTSSVSIEKTAAEISDILRRGGAQAVLTEYDEKGEYISAISFRIKFGEQFVTFRLPCDWKPVYEIMYKDASKRNIWDESRKRKIESERRQQALRTAWRIVKDWVEAQMALVETKMVKTEQVFLPYAVMKNGQTLGEHLESNPSFLLGNGS